MIAAASGASMDAFAGKTLWAMPMTAIGNIPMSGVDAGDYIRPPLSSGDEDQRLSGPMPSQHTHRDRRGAARSIVGLMHCFYYS
jgi:hypothetical protein